MLNQIQTKAAGDRARGRSNHKYFTAVITNRHNIDVYGPLTFNEAVKTASRKLSSGMAAGNVQVLPLIKPKGFSNGNFAVVVLANGVVDRVFGRLNRQAAIKLSGQLNVLEFNSLKADVRIRLMARPPGS